MASSGSRLSTVLRNIATNWLGFVVNAGVTLLLTPFVLAHLGTARYGVWILTSSLIGYYGVLDLGLRAGVTQHLTQFIARREFRAASETLSSAVAAFGGFAALLAGLSFAAAFLAPRLFAIDAHLADEAFWCILVVGIGTAVQYALCPFASVFAAAQRFDLASYIGMGSRLFTAAGIVLVLNLGYGLVGVSIVACAANILDYTVRWRVALRIVPELVVAREFAGMARLREVFSFGIWNFLITLNRFAYQHLPNIIIAALLAVTAVGYYSLATGLLLQMGLILSPIGQVLYPAAAALHAQEDRAGVLRLYHDGSRLVMLAMIVVVLIAGFWAEDFYRLWVGPQFVSGATYPSVALLMRILIISIATTFVSNVGAQVLVGAGHVRVVAISLIFGSAISLGLALALIQPLGLIGVAIGTVTASIVVDLIAIPLIVQRKLGFGVLDFLRRACARPALFACLCAPLLASLKLLGEPRTWSQLLLTGVAAGLVCIVVGAFVGVTRDERQRMIVRPLRRVFARFGAPVTPDSSP
jgi:O-antigen/teichoic acid export membrane protein